MSYHIISKHLCESTNVEQPEKIYRMDTRRASWRSRNSVGTICLYVIRWCGPCHRTAKIKIATEFLSCTPLECGNAAKHEATLQQGGNRATFSMSENRIPKTPGTCLLPKRERLGEVLTLSRKICTLFEGLHRNATQLSRWVYLRKTTEGGTWLQRVTVDSWRRPFRGSSRSGETYFLLISRKREALADTDQWVPMGS